MRVALLPLLVASAQAAFRAVSDQAAQLHLRSAGPIRPALEPESDKKFFKQDYPWDKRPVADKYYVFDHPYPAVQDSGDYDTDYVKDENSDGGKWQAQMDYDKLRSKIRVAKDKLKELKQNMEKEYEDWMRSKDKAEHSAQEADEAGKSAGSAKAAADAAAKKVNDLEGRSGKDGTKVGGDIGDAIKKVEDEMDDLEKCKKNLEDAKRKLKDLLKEKEEFQKRQKAAKDADEKAEKEAAEEAKKRKERGEQEDEEEKKRDEEDRERRKKNGEEDESSFDEEAWHKKLEKEKKQHAEALKTYEEELKDVKLTEDKLARAADNLRKFRRPPYVDDDGGVYYVPKSNTISARAPVVIFLTVLGFVFA